MDRLQCLLRLRLARHGNVLIQCSFLIQQVLVGAHEVLFFSSQAYEDSCRIPDDCIDSKRYPLFMARAVLQELIESLQSTQGVKPC